MKFRRLIVLIGLLHGFAAVAEIALASGEKLPGQSKKSAPSIAVAPFAATADLAEFSRSLAELLSEQLRQIPRSRVLGPEEIDLPALSEPEPRMVRSWSKRAGVELMLVGRLERIDAERLEVVAEVRSGHSGAGLARHKVRLEEPDQGNLDAAAAELAAQLLDQLGYLSPEAGLPPVAAAGAAADGAGSGGAEARDGPELGSPRPDEPIEIHSDEMEIIDGEDQRHVVFNQNVQVVQGDVTLWSDQLDVYYRDSASQPERLVASGSVRVEQGGRQASCDRAEYLREAQILVCSGHAELVQGCDHVRGDRIEFDFESERARVTGAPSLEIHPEDGENTACPRETP